MTPIEVEPNRSPAQLRIGVAVASFNQTITDRLLAGALSYLKVAEVGETEILRVAGAWELPVASALLFERGCSGVVAIGAVIKGETDHYEVIVRESAAGLTMAALSARRPVGNAVLAAHDYEQALVRSEPGPANKGAEAAAAVVDLACKAGS